MPRLLFNPLSGQFDLSGNSAAGPQVIATTTAATTANLTATYNNGASGVGATLTNSGAQAALVVDGYTVVVGDRILVKNQSTAAQNGVYIVTNIGSVSINWVLTRSTDYDTVQEIVPGTIVPVEKGSTNALTLWFETATVNTIGSDSINFSELSTGTLIFQGNSGSSTPAGLIENIIGQYASTTHVMDAIASGSTVSMENRAWETQYVVDPSSTAGLRGTFTTIQAAINQAVTDGMLYTNPKKVYIRTGTYTENLTIPGGTMLVGETFGSPTGGVITPAPTVISGVHTLSGNAVCAFNNLTFNNLGGSADTFSGGTIDLCYFDNCLLQSTSSGNHVNCVSANSYFRFQNCSFVNTGDQTCFTASDASAHIYLDNCVFAQPAAFAWAGDVNLYQCQGVGAVVLAATSLLTALYTIFTSSASYVISGTGATASSILYCYFPTGPALANTVNPAITFANNSCGSTTIPSQILYQAGSSFDCVKSQQGNIIKSVTTATNHNVDTNDFYIGVTSTAAPRSIFFDQVASPDQIYIVKDESGGAGTNAITLTTSGGTITFDGVTSFVLNNDYGSVTLKFDGTNYFIL